MPVQEFSRAIARLSRKVSGLFSGAPSPSPLPLPIRAPVTAKPFAPLLHDAGNSAAAIRILVFADGPGATQIISFDLPLLPARESGKVQLTILSEADFEHLSGPDANQRAHNALSQYDPTHVIVSRFGGRGASGIVSACEKRGQSFVMHLDDNLFEVPEALGPAKFKKYNAPDRLARMRLLCERASTVYASTEELARQLETLGLSTPISAGAMYCAAPCAPVPYAPAAPAVIGYMGSSGHAQDLEMIVPAIAEVLREYPQVRFETFGSIKMPKALQAEFSGRVSARPAAGSYREFMSAFQAMSWSVGLAPLESNPFNGCKANTKFIEYTVAGMPCVASDSIVYQSSLAGGRGILASTEQEWREAIRQLLGNPEMARKMVETAQDDLKTRWSQARLLEQLVDICNLPKSLLDH